MIQRFPGFIGPSYLLRSVNIDCQRTINLYPEMNEMGKGKGDEIASLIGTPGLRKIAEVGSGPIRLIHFDGTPTNPENPVTRIFVVSGNEVYKFENIASVWTPSLMGTIDSNTGPVSAASNKVDLGQTVFVDGENSYLYKKYMDGGPVEEFGTFDDFDLDPVANATQVIFVDGYFLYINNTGDLFSSNLNSLEIDPTSFAEAEGSPDNLIGILSNQRDIWLFNERTTEIFINTGNADFPFERVQGGFIEKGCVAPFSIAKIDNYVFWLGRDAAGQGIVYAGRGLNPERISTHAIEFAIQGYADISTARAYTYQSGGHSFYVLNFAEATWVFDMTSKLWHERAFTNDGILERHRADTYAFIPEFGLHMVGDYQTNEVYVLDEEYYTDDGNPITRLRAAPHISANNLEVACSYFQIDIQSGVGLDGVGQGTDPKLMMRFSDDGGHTWSNEKTVGMGKIGQTRFRAIFRRLGIFRDRVFEVKITDPVKVILIGALFDLEVGSD